MAQQFVKMDWIGNRVTGLGGGVGCYIRNDIAWQRTKHLETENVKAIWIKIFIKNSSPLLVCIIYRPPDTSRFLHSDFEDIFSYMLDDGDYENKETIL